MAKPFGSALATLFRASSAAFSAPVFGGVAGLSVGVVVPAGLVTGGVVVVGAGVAGLAAGVAAG